MLSVPTGHAPWYTAILNCFTFLRSKSGSNVNGLADGVASSAALTTRAIRSALSRVNCVGSSGLLMVRTPEACRNSRQNQHAD